MNYNNLLLFLLKYNNRKDEVTNAQYYKQTIYDKNINVEYKIELKTARKEYLEFIKRG